MEKSSVFCRTIFTVISRQPMKNLSLAKLGKAFVLMGVTYWSRYFGVVIFRSHALV
ncbi:hypothetical protein [Hoylesella oralis]|uniref:hypothetical protein n=1 Tax=Hoylesella oralis TaxID=28134 RepID=UPI00190EF97B|nr:hypothetical protein [Hoylesella oralis]